MHKQKLKWASWPRSSSSVWLGFACFRMRIGTRSLVCAVLWGCGGGLREPVHAGREGITKMGNE